MKAKNSRGTFSFSLLTQVLLLWLPLLLVLPRPALGYADPGTGAFLYQAFYAAFLGGTFYLRKILDRLWGKRRQK
jgi:hypothetical protein